jgi:hypothetical protein
MKGSRGDWPLYTPRPFPVKNLPQLSPIIPALARPSPKSNHSHTYADTRGRGVWSYQFDSVVAHLEIGHYNRKSTGLKGQRYISDCGKCRRADIFDYLPCILTFLECVQCNRGRAGKVTFPTGDAYA